MKPKLLLPLILVSIVFALAGCNSTPNPQETGKSTLNIQPRVVKAYKPEEKTKMIADLTAALKAEKYDAFADLLAQIYQRGLQGDQDFTKIESQLYVKGTEYFTEGLTDQAYKMANTVFAKVFESWRFKYLKIRCLERYGQLALDKKDYAQAKDYARQILTIEFRPEGADLTAKIAIQEAQAALQKKDMTAAKAALAPTIDLEINPDLRKQVDELAKKIGN